MFPFPLNKNWHLCSTHGMESTTDYRYVLPKGEADRLLSEMTESERIALADEVYEEVRLLAATIGELPVSEEHPAKTKDSVKIS